VITLQDIPFCVPIHWQSRFVYPVTVRVKTNIDFFGLNVCSIMHLCYAVFLLTVFCCHADFLRSAAICSG